jgi:hypothetical protein
MKKLVLSMVPLTFAALLTLQVDVPSAAADHQEEFTVLTVDVALDGNTYRQNDVDPSEGTATFSRGDTLVVDGTIYPGHTLPSGTANNDPNAPGGIGKMICRGAYLEGSPELNTAPFLTFVTELYLLPDHTKSLIADGFGPNTGVSARRAVLGGTGQFKDAVGELREENLGFNRTGACNLRMTFKLKKAGPGH